MSCTKSDRLREFARRIELARPARDFGEAMKLIAETLLGVEDELSGVPYSEEWPVDDGRMYPPLEDNRLSWSSESVKAYRNRGHLTLIGENGAIEIREKFGEQVVVSKLGADGKGVDE